MKTLKAIFTGNEIENQIFSNYDEGLDESTVFSAGKLIPNSSNRRLFTMIDMSMLQPFDLNSVMFQMRDRAGKERFSIGATQGFGSHSEYVLKDHNQGEIIKVKGNNTEAYMQMPKSNTKVIIGGFSNNPIIGNNKFVVLGNSLIDGEISTNAYSSNNSNLVLKTNGIERFTINQDGRIGIGTTDLSQNNSDSKLLVNGKILCEEVEVILDVAPDFVFQKYYTGYSTLKADYIMPTLEEVEAFTKENHHLPEVPSAEQIKEEGLQLKEMTTLLLQKVEELTLYTIEQEKRIKLLEEQLAKKQ